MLKQGKIFWFKSDVVTPVSEASLAGRGASHATACLQQLACFLLHGVITKHPIFNGTHCTQRAAAHHFTPPTQDSVPRGVIEVKRCLSIKGAEDAINKPHAFEIATTDDSMFFIADSDKEKEDWINAVGRAIVKHSRSLMDNDQADYTTAG